MSDLLGWSAIVPGVGYADKDGRILQTFEQKSHGERALARSRRTILPEIGLGFKNRVTGELETPFCDTGVKNTVEQFDSLPSPELPVEAMVDYLSVVLRGSDALDRARMWFGAGLTWQEGKRGGHGYECSCRRGGVVIYYGGDLNADTVFVQASGEGCRELEASGLVGGQLLLEGYLPWQAFLSELIEDDCHIKRLDFAIDDTKKVLDLDIIADYWRNDDVATHIKTFDRVQGTAKGGEKVSDTVYLGSRQSLMFVRIYNKKLEQINKGNIPAFDHWVRFELELKGEKAHEVSKMFVEKGLSVVPGVIRGLIDFKDPDDFDQNQTRRASAPWWSGWLSSVERLRVVTAPKVASIAKTANWIENQCAVALHILAHSPGYGRKFLEKVIRNGGERLTMAQIKNFFPYKAANKDFKQCQTTVLNNSVLSWA